jgi:hypothetical protein
VTVSARGVYVMPRHMQENDQARNAHG